MPSERSMEEFHDWLKTVRVNKARYTALVNSQPSWWTYDTVAQSGIDGREFHVWERVHQGGRKVYALRPIFAGNATPTPPSNSSGYYDSADALLKMTGIDVRGR